MTKTQPFSLLTRVIFAGGLLLIFMSVKAFKVDAQGNHNDRNAIALIRANNLYIMDSDGSNQRQITSIVPGPTDHPSWSPDGINLVFDAMVNNKPEDSRANINIFVTDIDTLAPINLTNNAGYDNVLPIWSPKGDKIAFVSNRSGNWQIFLMNIDGSGQVRLTSGEADDGIHGLTWSPDGRKIVFVSNRDQGRNSATGNYEDENLYLMNVPEDVDNFGNIEIQNITSAIHQCPAGENYRNPAWSKDNQLAFAASDCTINWDIFTFSIDAVLAGKTKDIQYFNLTRRVNEDGALGLSWSPDASKIIFVSNDPEVTNATSEDIFVVNVTETLKTNIPQIIQLTDDPNINNSYGFPTWQPEHFKNTGSNTPIPSPQPTSSNDEKAIYRLQELILSNSDCTLPCFAGLNVGTSDTNDIKKFVRQVDYNNVVSDQIGDSSPYNFSLFPSDKGLLTVGLSTSKDILQRARIGITDPRSWLAVNVFELSDVIADLGVPEKVYMVFSGPPLGFTMNLVYNKQGIMIRYLSTFKGEDLDDDIPLPICFNPKQVDLYQIDVWLQNPDNADLVEKNQPDLHDVKREIRPYWPLQKSVGISEDEFAKFFSENPNNCIQGLTTAELQKEGYVF